MSAKTPGRATFHSDPHRGGPTRLDVERGDIHISPATCGQAAALAMKIGSLLTGAPVIAFEPWHDGYRIYWPAEDG